VTRQDPGAARGVTPREPGRCRCGALEPLHVLSRGGTRGGCPHTGCRKYVESGAGTTPAPAPREA